MQTCVRCEPKAGASQLAISAAHKASHGTSRDTGSLTGAEMHETPSAALDQRQSPTPATVLRPPPGC